MVNQLISCPEIRLGFKLIYQYSMIDCVEHSTEIQKYGTD